MQERVWEVMGTRNYKIACELLLGAVTSGERGVPHAGNTADTTYRVHRKLGIIIRWESCQLFSYLITTNTQSYIPSRQITDVRAPASPTRKSTAFFRCENKAQNMSKNQIPVTFSVLVLFVFQKLFCLALKSLPLFG